MALELHVYQELEPYDVWLERAADGCVVVTDGHVTDHIGFDPRYSHGWQRDSDSLPITDRLRRQIDTLAELHNNNSHARHLRGEYQH